MTAPTTAAQLANADGARTAVAAAVGPDRYIDADVDMLTGRYHAELVALTERGGMPGIVRTGGNFFAIEGPAGLSPDNQVMFYLATNAVEGGLEFDPAESTGWVVGLYGVESNELIVSGDNSTDIGEAYGNAFAVLRGQK